MIRVSRTRTLWLVGAMVSLSLLACNRDKGRETAVPGDSLGAPMTDSLPVDTMGGDTSAVPGESAAGTSSARGGTPGAVAQATPAPPQTTPPAKPDTPPTPAPLKPQVPPVKPNIDPAPAGEPPKVPRPAEVSAAPQDTGTQGGGQLRDQYHQAPKDTVSQDVYNGWKQFNLNCARCHGEDVLGTTIAPHLITSLKPNGPINTKELFIETVCHGRPEKGMPAWCPLGLDTTKIEQVYSYVKGRSDAKIGPGRPAVKP